MAEQDLGGLAPVVDAAPDAEYALDALDARPREPEQLVLPAGAVAYLLGLALRTELGAAWWSGFVCAHGEPSWVVARAWAIRTGDAQIVRAPGGEE